MLTFFYMKKEIHPKYEKTIIECSCGSKFTTRSSASHIKLDICSECHPFYTGTQKLIDTAGRVDKFQAKIKKAEEHKKKQEELKQKKSIKKIDKKEKNETKK